MVQSQWRGVFSPVGHPTHEAPSDHSVVNSLGRGIIGLADFQGQTLASGGLLVRTLYFTDNH